MDEIQIGIEATLAFLLVITIFYSLHLGAALTTLRRDRGELGALILSLETSMGDARAGIEKLRQTTETSTRQLGKSVESGKALRADLEELYQLGEQLAAKLRVHTGPQVGRLESAHATVSGETERESRIRHETKTAAERELLRALRTQRA